MPKIKDLPKHKRPREKLSERGAESLSDAELLAILIRTGRAGKSALDIAKEALRKYPLSKLLAVDQKAHDGGEFFTPISLVSLIANVLEPKRGTVLDPACGSGGMFVQSARFVENLHENPNDKLNFCGLEKNGTTINLAKMNLAVHGLVGDIKKAITYYEDPHNLHKKADFVMANPPFNVDEIDAEKIKNDPRLPFGLPGINKKGKVSNGNYVWISYFYSYPKEKVLMIDARNIYRKVTRKIYDFSPEQLQNILSIVWLYRGETKRFHDLVVNYISKSLEEAVQSIPLAADYDEVFDKLHKQVEPFIATLSKDSKSAETIKELVACLKAYKDNCKIFFKLAEKKLSWWLRVKGSLRVVDAVKELELFADENNKLIKEAELMFRLINRLIDECLNAHNAKESQEWKTKEIVSLKKQTEEARDIAVNQLKIARYFYHQADWLIERFPDEKLRDVEGLVKLAGKEELKENDWSLTPGRYVGVAPEEEDPDFDFWEAMRAIHEELEGLNVKAGDLAKNISENFRKLGI